MPRGGARPGAGRKPKAAPAAACPPVTKNGVKDDPKWPFGHLEMPAEPAAKSTKPAPPPVEPDASPDAEQSPLDYLLEVMRDRDKDPRIRIQAASLAAPYVHPRKGESKKTSSAKPGSGDGGSKYTARQGPRLVSSK